MAELLLELYSEEIPARMQGKAATDMQQAILSKLSDVDVVFGDSKICYSPQRIAISIKDLPIELQDSQVEKRGPRVDAPEAAIQGFLNSNGMTIDQLEKRSTPKGDFYFAVIRQKGRKVSEILDHIITQVISSYSWPKSMKWGSHDIRWVRPLHNILCVFNKEVVPLVFGHLTANNKTYGHRFMSPGEIVVEDFVSYEQKLKDAFVIVDPEKRRQEIFEQLEHEAHSYGLKIKKDSALLDEVTGLVEYPVALIGKIDHGFMGLPKEVLSTSMRVNQKYFSLVNADGSLAPYFITVSNIKTSDQGQKIVAGNERVLKARLDDANFFWNQDRKNNLESNVDSLKKIVFHAKLGTVYEKVERIQELGKLFSVWVPHANLVLVERAAQLCKADLTTEMVGEFPELQGLMGKYYAIESKEEQEVADAIYEHYKPLGSGDDCPKKPLSIAVALADKIDTLVGLFLIGEKPTGSKDPFALRRAALGVIRIILENGIRSPLKLMFEKALDKYPKALLKPEKGDKEAEKAKYKRERVVNELLLFFEERIKALLKGQGVKHDHIAAVFDGGTEDDLVRLVSRVLALKDFVSTEDGQNLFAAYKRASNIVVAEEKRDKQKYTGNPDKSSLATIEEQDLYDAYESIKSKVDESLKGEDYVATMKELSILRDPIDRFFDNVQVNSDDESLRKNRLNLLSQFRNTLNSVANFSVIEG